MHPIRVEGLLGVYRNVVEVLLVLEIFLTKNSEVEDLLCGALSSSEACLFFINDLLRFRLQANEADRSVVLALLQVAFLGKCDDRGLGPKGLAILISAKS